MEIDLNADLGEGAGRDAELLALVTSANVSCGFHAGDPQVIRETLNRAPGPVVLGAHPGYADRENFGRKELALSCEAIFNLCVYQIGALVGLAKANARVVRYVKPHGALYNQACRDDEVALAVVEAARLFELRLVGLPNSEVERLADRFQVPFVREGFADRRYRPDGTLVPRTEPDAFVHDPDEAVRQVEWLVRECGVRTVCVHGDNPEAVAFATAVRRALLDRGFTLKPFA